MRTKLRLAIATVAIPTLIAAVVVAGQTPSFGYGKIRNKVIIHQLDMLTGKVKANIHFPQVSSGVMEAAMQTAGLLPRQSSTARPLGVAGPSTLNTQGCSQTLFARGRKNIK